MILFKTQKESLKVKPNFYFNDQVYALSQTFNAHKEIYECIFKSRAECLTNMTTYLIAWVIYDYLYHLKFLFRMNFGSIL